MRHLQWPHKWISALIAVDAHTRQPEPMGTFEDTSFCHWMTQWTDPMVVLSASCLLGTLLSLPAAPRFPWIPSEFTSRVQQQAPPWGSLWLTPWGKAMASRTIHFKASSWKGNLLISLFRLVFTREHLMSTYSGSLTGPATRDKRRPCPQAVRSVDWFTGAGAGQGWVSGTLHAKISHTLRAVPPVYFSRLTSVPYSKLQCGQRHWTLGQFYTGFGLLPHLPVFICIFYFSVERCIISFWRPLLSLWRVSNVPA